MVHKLSMCQELDIPQNLSFFYSKNTPNIVYSLSSVSNTIVNANIKFGTKKVKMLYKINGERDNKTKGELQIKVILSIHLNSILIIFLFFCFL